MRVNLQIKGFNDIDLLAMAASYGKQFNKFVKKAIVSYIRDIPLDENIREFDANAEIPKSKVIDIRISETEEADIIEYLSRIKNGYTNKFIKNVLRYYCMRYMDSFYLEDQAYAKRMIQNRSNTAMNQTAPAPMMQQGMNGNPMPYMAPYMPYMPYMPANPYYPVNMQGQQEIISPASANRQGPAKGIKEDTKNGISDTKTNNVIKISDKPKVKNIVAENVSDIERPALKPVAKAVNSDIVQNNVVKDVFNDTFKEKTEDTPMNDLMAGFGDLFNSIESQYN